MRNVIHLNVSCWIGRGKASIACLGYVYDCADSTSDTKTVSSIMWLNIGVKTD